MNHKLTIQSNTAQTQKLKITPSLKKALRILTASHLDLNQLVDTALLENPVLEREEALTSEEEWAEEKYYSHALDDLNETAHSPSLTERLNEQLDFLRLSKEDEYIAQSIINNLDERGYLTLAPKALRWQLGLDKPPSSVYIKKILSLIQQFEPAGIAATSHAECLRLQLMRLPNCSIIHEKALFILNHMPDLLGTYDLKKIQRRAGISHDTLLKIIALLNTLDSEPASRYHTQEDHAIIPDIFVEKKDGHWLVRLNPSLLPTLKISQYYLQLSQKATSLQDQNYLTTHLRDARFLLSNIEKRNKTLRAIANAIVEQQHDFLNGGQLVSMTMTQLAQDLKCHPSTISRAVSNKYLQTPRGTFALRSFFIANLTLKQSIKLLIQQESQECALTDNEISNHLKQQSLLVTTRQVAKLRKSLNIAPAHQRRRMITTVSLMGAKAPTEPPLNEAQTSHKDSTV